MLEADKIERTVKIYKRSLHHIKNEMAVEELKKKNTQCILVRGTKTKR